MKRIGLTIFGLILATATLTGCGASGAPEEANQSGSKIGGVRTSYVELPDGRKVLCVSNQQGYSGGITCDWENASAE